MRKKRILFVDDEVNVLQSYRRSLRDHCDIWELEFASCPHKAWLRLQTAKFDTVVSDIRMPGMSGVELLSRVKQDPRLNSLPVIIVTGEADTSLKRNVLDLDAADLLNKPVNRDDLIARIRSALRVSEYANQLKQSNELLEQRVLERTAALNSARIDTLWRLSKAAEFRDEETGNHVIRVGSYSKIIARALGLSQSYCETIYLAAPLHDIGKIGVPDSVLLKPGKLTDEEWRVMRSHCEIGVSILSDRCQYLDFVDNVEPVNNPVIELAAEIAASHHERWDGSGYPSKICGDAIPLSGRIVAIADVYDALRSARSYKEPFSVEHSLDIICNESGTLFDPTVVDALTQSFDEILAVEIQLTDELNRVTLSRQDVDSLARA